MDPITEALRKHYADAFERHGASSLGVDWGVDASRMLLRYDKMLAVIEGKDAKPSLLDVGCGYGGLCSHAAERGIALDYTGIDVADNMVQWAQRHASTGAFVCGDALEHQFGREFDYVVCSGVLTQKLEASAADMDRYAARLIRRLFALCRRGAAFNVMTTKVNFFANNLYYRNPAEMVAWCLTEITPRLRIDHAYPPLYEYTIYLYR
jgi:2-polyprenyl-3-methyl-5-hydroxy-6-metoxy-1,4-benzoquinol methylase